MADIWVVGRGGNWFSWECILLSSLMAPAFFYIFLYFLPLISYFLLFRMVFIWHEYWRFWGGLLFFILLPYFCFNIFV